MFFIFFYWKRSISTRHFKPTHFFAFVKLLVGTFMWSFRESCRGSGTRSRGLKTLLLLDGIQLAVHRRDAKGRRFRGHSFFSIKALSLVPSLTDLHLFEPRPSKRRSDEKLDGIRGDRSVNFTGTSDYSARWRRTEGRGGRLLFQAV